MYVQHLIVTRPLHMIDLLTLQVKELAVTDPYVRTPPSSLSKRVTYRIWPTTLSQPKPTRYTSEAYREAFIVMIKKRIRTLVVETSTTFLTMFSILDINLGISDISNVTNDNKNWGVFNHVECNSCLWHRTPKYMY